MSKIFITGLLIFRPFLFSNETTVLTEILPPYNCLRDNKFVGRSMEAAEEAFEKLNLSFYATTSS